MVSLPLADASAAFGVLLLVAFLAVYFGYWRWLTHGLRARPIDTALAPDQLRMLFEQKVAVFGWSIVDPGNPMVAQSTILTGIRQQIALTVHRSEDGRTEATVDCVRYAKKIFGPPTKAHTVRMRIDRFMRAVQAQGGSPAGAIPVAPPAPPAGPRALPPLQPAPPRISIADLPAPAPPAAPPRISIADLPTPAPPAAPLADDEDFEVVLRPR